MTTFPDPADLYPDVAAQGSLAAALQTAAAGQGIEIGEVLGHEREPLCYAGIASSSPLREPLAVQAGHVARYWLVEGWGQGIWLIGGKALSLDDVIRAARGWRDGIPLRDIQRSAPFVELTYLAEAAERGPEHVVSTQWQWLRDDAEESNWPEYRALVEAAYTHPRLRQLYAYTSHWSLRFSTTTGYRFSPDVVCLEVSRQGRFTVRTAWQGAVLGQTTTAMEAAAVAAAHLPIDLGPAVAGPYQYPQLTDDSC